MTSPIPHSDDDGDIEAPSIDGLVAKIHSMIGWALLGDQRRTHIGRAEVFFSRRTMHAEHPDRCREAEDEVDEYEVILRNTPDSGIEEADEVCIFYRDHKLVYELRRKTDTHLPAKMAAEVDELGERGLQWVYAQISTQRVLTPYDKAKQLRSLISHGSMIAGTFPVRKERDGTIWVMGNEGLVKILKEESMTSITLMNEQHELVISAVEGRTPALFLNLYERGGSSPPLYSTQINNDTNAKGAELLFHQVLDTTANLLGYNWR